MPEPTQRPESVPSSAHWEEADNEYCDCRRVDGKKEGKGTWYRPDGSVACEAHYVAGEADGAYVRFHENGERSQVGTMLAGKRHGRIQWFRTTAETTEHTVPNDCPDSVRAMSTEFEHGIPLPSRFFDADGNEVQHTGASLPPRPKGVDARAAYNPDEDKWFFGRGVKGFDQRDGWWTWWDGSGNVTLKKHHVRGTATRQVTVHDDGKRTIALLKASGHPFETVVEPSENRPDTIDESALQTQHQLWLTGPQLHEDAIPHGAWQWRRDDGTLAREAEIEGGVLVQERFFDEQGRLKNTVFNDADGRRIRTTAHDANGALVTSVGEPLPPRPDTVDPSAAFDAQDELWVAGPGLDGGQPPQGEWSWWTPDGRPSRQHVYEGGKRRVERKFHDNGTLFVERVDDAQGRRVRTAYFYKDGDLNHTTDNTFDGETLSKVEIHKYGIGLRARGIRDEQGLAFEFFDAEGAIEARGHVEGRTAVGTWTFVDEGTRYTLDLTEQAPTARVDENFQPGWLLAGALLPKEADKPVPEQLAGARDIAWEDVPSCYGDAEGFDLYLRALVSDVAAVRNSALGEIESETLHQGTVYVATARVLPFLVRAMEHPNADVGALVEYIYSVVSSAAPWRSQAAEWGDEDDRTAILGTLGAVSEHFDAIATAAARCGATITPTILGLAQHGGASGKALLQRTLEAGPPDHQAIAARGLLQRDEAKPADAEPLLQHAHPLVRCAAAITAADLEQEAPVGTADVLLESLAMLGDLRPAFAELPFAEVPLVVFLSLSLGNVRHEDAARGAVQRLLEHVDTVGWSSRPLFYRGLFDLCFGRGEPPFADNFVQVFQHVAADSGLDGFVNFFEEAQRWNLPTNRRDYRTLVDDLQKAEDPTALMVDRFFTVDVDE